MIDLGALPSLVDRGWAVRVADGAMPTLVWLHGLGERVETFASIASQPALRAHRQVFVELPGHGAARALEEQGAAAWSTPPSIDETADLLAAWLAPGPPVVVLGHSLGGVIALALAERAPHLLRAVIDLDGNVALPDCTYSAQIAAYPRDAFLAHGHATVCARIAASTDATIAGYGARMATASPAQLWQYSGDLVAASTPETSARRRAAVTVPYLYIAGEPGGASPRSRALLAEAGVRCVAIAPAGHWPFVDQPAATAAAIADALTAR